MRVHIRRHRRSLRRGGGQRAAQAARQRNRHPRREADAHRTTAAQDVRTGHDLQAARRQRTGTNLQCCEMIRACGAWARKPAKCALETSEVPA